MKIAAVIFDMDGLMLDTERIYHDVFNRAAVDCSVEFPDSLHDQLRGRNSADVKSILREQMQDEALFERFIECLRQHHAVCFAQAPPIKNGLNELLDLLEARNVPKVVATSSSRKTAFPRLESCGLLNRFASINCGDQVERGKPAPDLFLLAASTIPAAPSECVVLEDSEAGVTAAHAAGMTVCMVPDLKQPANDIRGLVQGVYQSLVEVRHFLEANLPR